MIPPDGRNVPSSAYATETTTESSKILMKIVLLKPTGSNGKSIATYGDND